MAANSASFTYQDYQALRGRQHTETLFREFCSAFGNITNEDGDRLLPVTDGQNELDRFLQRQKFGTHTVPDPEFDFELTGKTVREVEMECRNHVPPRNLSDHLKNWGNKIYYTEGYNLAPGEIKWVELSRPEASEYAQELSEMIFLDYANNVVDWQTSLANLKRLGKDRLYTENMMHTCLIRLVNKIMPDWTDLLKEKTSNDIAVFLLLQDSKVDKLKFYRKKLQEFKRLPAEDFQSAITRFNSLADKVYPVTVDNTVNRSARENATKTAIVSFTPDPAAGFILQEIKASADRCEPLSLEDILRIALEADHSCKNMIVSPLQFGRQIGGMEHASSLLLNSMQTSNRRLLLPRATDLYRNDMWENPYRFKGLPVQDMDPYNIGEQVQNGELPLGAAAAADQQQGANGQQQQQQQHQGNFPGAQPANGHAGLPAGGQDPFGQEDWGFGLGNMFYPDPPVLQQALAPQQDAAGQRQLPGNAREQHLRQQAANAAELRRIQEEHALNAQHAQFLREQEEDRQRALAEVARQRQQQEHAALLEAHTEAERQRQQQEHAALLEAQAQHATPAQGIPRIPALYRTPPAGMPYATPTERHARDEYPTVQFKDLPAGQTVYKDGRHTITSVNGVLHRVENTPLRAKADIIRAASPRVDSVARNLNMDMPEDQVVEVMPAQNLGARPREAAPGPKSRTADREIAGQDINPDLGRTRSRSGDPAKHALPDLHLNSMQLPVDYRQRPRSRDGYQSQDRYQDRYQSRDRRPSQDRYQDKYQSRDRRQSQDRYQSGYQSRDRRQSQDRYQSGYQSRGRSLSRDRQQQYNRPQSRDRQYQSRDRQGQSMDRYKGQSQNRGLSRDRYRTQSQDRNRGYDRSRDRTRGDRSPSRDRYRAQSRESRRDSYQKNSYYSASGRNSDRLSQDRQRRGRSMDRQSQDRYKQSYRNDRPRSQSQGRTDRYSRDNRSSSRGRQQASQQSYRGRTQSRDRNQSNDRRRNLSAEARSKYPLMRKGDNCRSNYNPYHEKSCRKCGQDNTHHEFECPKYRTFNPSICGQCEKFNHWPKDCMESEKFPPKTSQLNSILAAANQTKNW